MYTVLPRIVVVTGHYGSGKTNVSINMAVELSKLGRRVVLADLDVVNPYFRSADWSGEAKKLGIELIAPAYASSNLDIPALTGRLGAALVSDKTVIIDVGGDDAGAYALGRYSADIVSQDYAMLYVVNGFRFLTRTPQEAVGLLDEIHGASRVPATHVVNCSNLAGETTAEDVLGSIPFAQAAADQAGLPLLGTAARRDIAADLAGKAAVFPVDIYVKTPW
ncbi:ParA family protein [Oscillospiraceae bacterium MB08-C2-2]|nr:ParA family protein [Oscillospiraceae bacterium MB08-C2-2]